FSSDVGVLTGSPNSPNLFNLAVADFKVVEHPDDVVLHDKIINHILQVDDTGMATTVASSMHSKLRQFEMYAAKTGFAVSVPKCLMAVFGKNPDPGAVFLIHGKPMRKETEFKYMGAWHQTPLRSSMCKKNYEAYAEKAKNIAGAVLHAKTFVGKDIPVWDMRQLYIGRVDPYLMNGAEFIADTIKKNREVLEAVQHYFLRRMLSLQSRSSLAVLFTETGLLPIRYRRIVILLKNMQYLVQLPHNHYAWKAFREAYNLAHNGKHTLFMETCFVFETLPIPVRKYMSLRLADYAGCLVWLQRHR
ncbi:hypothetical protein BT96DRAFT_817520, partial [Gymnopus androsaceus JB14]